MSTEWIDPDRSRIVLAGVPTYMDKQLQDYGVIRQNVTDLLTTLTDPTIGGLNPVHCFTSSPTASMKEIGGLLRKAANEAEDLLLFYYCGHGLIGADGDRPLYLSVHDTDRDLETFTAVPFEAVRGEFRRSRARRRVAILDCCFSGRAISGTLGSEDQEITAKLQMDSSYTLTAASRDQAALVLPGEHHTAFTGRLLKVLQEGKQDAGEALTPADIFGLLNSRLDSARLPKARELTSGGASQIPLVRNPAYTPRISPASPVTRVTSKMHQAFIDSIAPGAIAAQQRWGVPASVTIAQAIEESGWGTSQLSKDNHNLFGIKGSGPEGAAYYPINDYVDGRWITSAVPFRAYNKMTDSISDHAEVIATSQRYERVMARRHVPDAFAEGLTGIYSADPDYGSNLLATMKLYDLYRYDIPNRPRRLGGIAFPRTSTPPLHPQSLPSAGARYTVPLPAMVSDALIVKAKLPIAGLEQLYKDVSGHAGISWKLLAACDWMQCESDPLRSPVHGEMLGSVNRDGSAYETKGEALAQCAADMITLARAVYGLDLTVPRPMSVRALAEVFAAYRWGGLLKKHGVSAMEFPYSVAGLDEARTEMRWPSVSEPNAPDEPGSKFGRSFGAVSVMLSLKYPATV